MCGITAYIDFTNGINIDVLMAMTEVIRHRGPDDEGYAIFSQGRVVEAYGADTAKDLLQGGMGNIREMENESYFMALGHRRLSILDVSSAGHQPMSWNNGLVWCTYNGEIYNYIEVREELQKEGYHFCTESDTEILLCAYMHWGENCVTHFNGMWAFALYDVQRQTLFCSRDRMGAKPLYYYNKKGLFLCGSELKQFIQHPHVERVIDEEALSGALLYDITDCLETTLVQNVRQLKGGHNLSIKLNVSDKLFYEPKIYSYWELNTEYFDKPPKEGYAQMLKREFSRAIKWRMRSDVKVGALLSGGLDSSALVTEVCNQIREQGGETNSFDTFTSCFEEGSPHDESYYAHLVNERCGCQENFIYPEVKDLKKEVERAVWHAEGSYALAIVHGSMVIGKARDKGIRVLLNGQGGDETLFGYERYFAFYFWDLLKRLQIAEAVSGWRAISKRAGLSLTRLVRLLASYKIPIWRESRRKWRANTFYSSALLQAANHKVNKQYIYFKNPKELQWNEIRGEQLTQILRLDDRMYMSHSVESRVPLIDYQYVETAARIPPKYKIKGGYSKALMREFMAEDMPPEVTYRMRKLGFSAPIKEWFESCDPTYIEELFTDCRSQKYFNIEKVRELYNKNAGDAVFLNFVTIETFMRLFDLYAPSR